MSITTTADQTAVACAIAVLKKTLSGRIVMATLRDSIDMGHIDSLSAAEIRAWLSLMTAIRDGGTEAVIDPLREVLSA